MLKKLFGLLIAFLMASQVYASIGVAPLKIEINANKSKNNYTMATVEVIGDKTQVMRYKMYTGFFDIGKEGEVVMLESNGAPNDISKKIKFVPSEFTVQPGKTQKVRINIPNLKSLPDGENRAMLYIEDVNVKAQDFNTGSKGIAAQLLIKMRVGVPIYVDAGKFYRKGEIEDFQVKEENGKYFLDYKVNSTGNSRIRYDACAQIIQDKKLVDQIRFYGAVVGANNTITQKNQVTFPKLAPGEYTVRLILSYTDEKGKKQHMQKDTTIIVKGEI